ncbi:MAG: oligosaccharide flippase family protein [Pygmaiobacter massiliensis]|nr:oligosaccharide flippase family protein [Pygmaiobacter massiliensis]
MDKYKRLLSNTVLFAISSFSSKVLVFVLMPFFTRVLDLGEFGDANLITKYAQLLIPLVSVGIANAVIRFGLDKSYDKAAVFTSGLTAIGIGTVLLFALWPVLYPLLDLQNHTWLLYAYVLMSVLRNLCSQFVRSKQYTRLYAVDGLLDTVLYLFFVVLFMGVFHWGITGYVLATAAADAGSAVFLFLMADLGRYVKFSRFDPKVFKKMVRYAVPLIPASMFWWITNTSDHVFVTYMLGDEMNGLYETAYRIPNIINLFATLFTEAWQLSAVTDGDRRSPGRARFFSKVFLSYQALLYICGAGLIYLAKVEVICLTASVDSPYYPAWQYVPILVIATIFSCFVSFLGSVYMVEMRSGQNLFTMMAGAILNLILNWFLIPSYGPNGAAFATFVSYLLVFLLRAVNTHQYIPIRLHLGRMTVSVGLLGLEAWLMMQEVKYWVVWCALVGGIVVLLNAVPLLQSVFRIIKRRKGGR